MEHSVGLQSKGQIAAVSQQRHLEYPGEIKDPDVVFPTDRGLVVPHLPEEPADQGAQGKGDDQPEIAVPYLRDDAGPACEVVDRVEDEEQAQPGERER